MDASGENTDAAVEIVEEENGEVPPTDATGENTVSLGEIVEEEDGEVSPMDASGEYNVVEVESVQEENVEIVEEDNGEVVPTDAAGESTDAELDIVLAGYEKQLQALDERLAMVFAGVDKARTTWLQLLDGAPIRKRDMDDLVMNFLLVEGYVEAAERFQQELGFEFVDASILEKLTSIKDCILRGQALEAINRINEWKPEILESNISVHVGLIKQNMIQLLSSNDTPEAALDYAREALVPLIEKDVKNATWIESAMMLFLHEDMEQSPCVSLSDRKEIAKDVIRSILPSVGRTNESKLPSFMKMLKYVQSQEVWWCRISDLRRPFVFDEPVS